MKREQIPAFMAGTKRNWPTLGQIVDNQTEKRPGGHLIWPHASHYIRPEGRSKVLIQRALFEAFNGPIPEGMNLLNACSVPGCVAPGCHVLSRYTKWRDVRARHSGDCRSDSRACAPNRSALAACVPSYGDPY